MKFRNLGANMAEFRTSDGNVLFFSYNTLVAGYIDNAPFKTSKKWSRTTSRHIKKYFLDEWGIDSARVPEHPQEYLDSIWNLDMT